MLIIESNYADGPADIISSVSFGETVPCDSKLCIVFGVVVGVLTEIIKYPDNIEFKSVLPPYTLVRYVFVKMIGCNLHFVEYRCKIK